MNKFFFFLLLLSLKGVLFAQSKQAERLFKTGNYSEAIPVLEADIKEKSNLNAKIKLAYCYRMTNQNKKALELYAQLAKKDKIRSEINLYYGEALMMDAQYDSAHVYFQKYFLQEPDDSRAKLMLTSLEQLKDIKPFFPNAIIHPFPYNSDADDSAPVMYKKGLVFSSDRNTGFKPLKEKSGATGRDYLNLYYAEFHKDTMFSKPNSFSGKINEMNRNSGSISFTSNDKLAFYSQNSAIASKQGTYNMQLFKAEASENGWQNIEILPFNTEENNLMHPAVSSDGTELFFTSNRSGGQGGTDIYRAKRNNRGNWSQIENLGAVVNTSASEGFPYMDRAGRLYFCSKGHPGYGGFDIFMTERDEYGNWKKPLNLGKPINSPSDDISFFLFYEGNSGVFTSNREGGDDDIYFFSDKDSLQFLKTEVAYRTQTFTVDLQKKDSVANKVEIIKTEKKEVEIAKVEEESEPMVMLEKVENLDTLIAFLEKSKLDTNFKISEKKTFLLENIHFSEKILLDSTSKMTLDKVKLIMDTYPLKLQFLVHTSMAGKEQENLDRSKKQGIRLVKYLADKGIERERLKSKGFGETMPRCEKDCMERFGKKESEANERVEIKISY